MAKYTEYDHARFFDLIHQQKIGWAKAGEIMGISRATAYRWYNGLQRKGFVDGREDRVKKKRSHEVPAPKTLADLDGGVVDTLKDFALWAEMFLAWRYTPWQRDAADRVTEWILDTSERTFADINLPPGAGKTTLFTFGIPAWLICGGGRIDPEFGRALRILLGSDVMNVSKHYVQRLARFLELRRPFYDKQQKRYAELVITDAFGRFKPLQVYGESVLWRAEQFIVAQLADIDLYEKEPTVQAASFESGFLGERVDYQSWDDLATPANSRNPEVAGTLAGWYEDQAETRTEPGGVCILVGQRLGPLDLHRNRLDQTQENLAGETVQTYKHVIYPAHFDNLCDHENHTQWDGEMSGCLLDAERLPWVDILRVRDKSNFRTVYQQEEADPLRVLVQRAWLRGEPDHTGYLSPGADGDHQWGSHPGNVGKLIDYVCVDPAAGNWWVIEWWAVQPETRIRYLIAGWRRKLQAGGFLDWNHAEQKFTGMMEDVQTMSVVKGHPVRVWIIESVSAFKFLFQYEHFRRWRVKWANVPVIAHETQRNKSDPELGLEALLQGAYKRGEKKFPVKKGNPEAVNYLAIKEKELTTHPFTATDDTVDADWFGENRLQQIIQIGARAVDRFEIDDSQIPAYLKRQRRSVTYAQS